MKTIVLGLLVLFSMAALADAADESLRAEKIKKLLSGPVGRYEMVRVIGGNQGGSAVMILDTANGDLWEWTSNPGTKGGNEVNVRLIYMGHVDPGGRMGEIIDKGAYPVR